MQGWAAQSLAVVQLPEGWSAGNVLGVLTLGMVVLALLAWWLIVTLRR